MCDYSLMAISNRLAVSGEDLVVHRFGSGSIGLASHLDLQKRREALANQCSGLWATLKSFFSLQEGPPIPAVCVPPGARLLVRDIPARLRQEGCLQPEEMAVFTQISAELNTFRDAVRFPSGVEILLQRFEEGQRVRILDVSSREEPEIGRRERPRVTIGVS